MAADIVPIRLGLTEGDLYTLWAPRWRDAADEWEAFLGKDEDFFAFETVADLVAFVRTDTDNDLSDHPAWKTLTKASAHELDPAKDKLFDVVGVPELVAEKPTEATVETLKNTLAIVASIGTVCELPAVTKLFNGNPKLATLSIGADYFSGKAGLKRWHEIEQVIGRNWDKVVDAIDEIVCTPEVDAEVSAQADAELLAAPENEVDDVDEDLDGEETALAEDGTPPPAPAAVDSDRESDTLESDTLESDTLESDTLESDTEESDDEADDDVLVHVNALVLGSDDDFWLKVGIDPVRMITGSGTFYTLRCWCDEVPVFLGRNGRISVFTSERALARYLADEHDHDLSNLSTYDDIRTAATDGSLQVDITPDNVYVLTGLADDITDGPDAVDPDQLDLAVELLRDVGEYSEDDTVDDALEPDQPLGKVVAFVLDPHSVSKPAAPYVKAAEQWVALEQFVDSRLRRE
jgi:hypothetical protein